MEYTKTNNDLQNNRCKELTEIFREGGFRCCVLKGQGTATLYPYPEYRQCGDIDMWVEGDRDAVIDFARNRRVKIPSIDVQHSEMEFFEDVSVEVHFAPSFPLITLLVRDLRNGLHQKQNLSLNIMMKSSVSLIQPSTLIYCSL